MNQRLNDLECLASLVADGSELFIHIGRFYGLATREPDVHEAALTNYHLVFPSSESWSTAALTVMPDIRERVFMPLGSVPGLAARLRRRGISVTVVDHRRLNDYARPSSTYLATLTDERAQFAATIAQNTAGIIEVRNEREARRFLAILLKLFPGTTRVVVVAGRSRGRHLLHLLKRYRVNAQVVSHQRRIVGVPIVISTILYSRDSDRDQADVLVFMHPSDLATERGRLAFKDWPHRPQRVYGISRRSERLSPYQRLLTDMRIGSVLYSTVPPLASVEYIMAPAVWSRSIWGESPLDRKRRVVWNHRYRNQRIADIATAIARGEPTALYDCGVILNDSAERWIRDRQPRVAVLVESLEHASQLSQHLPDWPIIASRSTDPAPLTEPFPVAAIVTMTAAMRMALPYDVIVRADVGTGGLTLREFPLPASEARGGRALVVDIGDEFDRIASTATLSRRVAYQTAGYEFAGSVLAAAESGASCTGESPAATSKSLSGETVEVPSSRSLVQQGLATRALQTKRIKSNPAAALTPAITAAVQNAATSPLTSSKPARVKRKTAGTPPDPDKPVRHHAAIRDGNEPPRPTSSSKRKEDTST